MDGPITANDTEQEQQEQTDKRREADAAKLLLARRRFAQAEEAENQLRLKMLDDLKFLAGEQWDEAIKRQRADPSSPRPCLTINRLKQHHALVVNDQRQNRPAIQVNPVDSDADVKTAEIFQGLIRHIELDSGADIAYDTAFQSTAAMGLGYFRIVSEYESDDSFNLVLKIRRILNPFSVYFDPSHQEPDFSDAEWAFIVQDWTRDEYLARFPDSQLASLADWSSIGDRASGWIRESGVRIAEYFYRDRQAVTLGQLSTGETVIVDMLPLGADGQPQLPEGATVVRTRPSAITVVRQCLLNAVETLEETTWPTHWIPIIPVLGTELTVDGAYLLEGIVRHAKDPQRMINYWASAETEMIALAPKAPYIVAEGQLEGHENEWKKSATKNYAYLEYKPISLNGEPVPPPQRNAYEPPVAAITHALLLSVDDLKATTGIFDPALGNRSNETSGRAILVRQQQSQVANFHYMDNLVRAMRHCGRILVELIPKIYGTERVVRIIGDEGDQRVVTVNAPYEEKGKLQYYDLTVGRYDVTISTGPSYASRRQEAVASMLTLTGQAPQLIPVIGDLLAKNMDWPGAQTIAERLKKMLPPELQDQPEGKPQLPPQLQQQFQEMGQMIEQLTQALKTEQEKAEGKTEELASRERIEFAKMHVDLLKAQAEIDRKDSEALLKAEMAAIAQRLATLETTAPLGTTDDGGRQQAMMEEQPNG